MPRPKFYIPKAENNIKLQLAGSVSSSATSGAVTSGGSSLPTIVRGSASSAGDETTLNDTGGFASGVSEGDFIENLTDGSNAFVLEVTSDDSIRTTPLEGGSDNTWQNGDVWAIGCYVGTLTQLDADGLIVKQERVKVTDRATNTLTWSRQYDGDASQSFNAGDWFYIMVEKSVTNEARKAFANILMRLEDFYRGLPHYAEDTGSGDAFEIELTHPISSYADIQGLEIRIKSSQTVSGPATLEINGLGTTLDIVKEDGATPLVSGDINTDQVFTGVVDGTDFKMTSPSGNSAPSAPVDPLLWGNASDGNVTLGMDTTLTRPMFYDTLDLAGYTLNMAGYPVYARRIQGAGKLKAPTGGNGGNGANSAGAVGTAGAAATGNWIPDSLAGSAGGIGGTGYVGSGGGGGTAGTAGVAGTAQTNALGANNGAAGGAGGPSGTSNQRAGGAGGGGGATTQMSGERPIRNYQMMAYNKGTVWTAFGGTGSGGGGGGGGGGSGMGSPAGGGGGSGGGSGGNGGLFFIAAKDIAGTWTIESIGGNGGNGGTGTGGYGGAGGGGGGAGGNGGSGVLVYNTSSWTGSATLTGGTGGTGGPGAASGGGGAGSAGTNGPSGNAGTLIEIEVP